MTVLLTGASGFLGRRVHALLRERGEEVITLGRSAAPHVPALGRHIRATLRTYGPSFELERAREAVGEVDWICHLAAYVPRDRGRDRAEVALLTNVLGSVALFEAFGRPGQANVVASSLEGTVIPSSTWYGLSKRCQEEACALLASRREMRMALLRFTVLYGHDDPIERAIPSFVKMARSGADIEVSGGEELRDYLHVLDAAAAVLAAHDRGLSGPYAVGTGEGISVLDAAAGVATVIGGRVSVHPRTTPRIDVIADTGPFMLASGWHPESRFPEGLARRPRVCSCHRMSSLIVETLPLRCESCGAAAERKAILEMSGFRGIDVPKGAPRPVMLCADCRTVLVALISGARELVEAPQPPDANGSTPA